MAVENGQASFRRGVMSTAALTMGKKLLGVTITRVPINMSLSCDANGNLR